MKVFAPVVLPGQKSLLIACLLGFLALFAPYKTEASDKKTFGFVFAHLNLAFYQTKFWDECPQGTALSTDEIWWEGMSVADRRRETNGGQIDPNDNVRQYASNQRGPNREDVCWRPDLAKDPPIREARGKFSYGVNLDGTTDGHATPTTCAHEKFPASPDGGEAIDNQLYRVMGCILGWRGDFARNLEIDANQDRRSSGRGITLMEISDVDDVRNDDDVLVTFFKTSDLMPRAADGSILPFGSYAIDTQDGVPRYANKVRGKIENGVLTTITSDLDLPDYGNEAFERIVLRNARLRFEISPDGSKAKGLLAGYYDLEKWWHRIRNLEYQAHSDLDCPAMYEAAYRLADGFPDPKTGRCTAISSALNIQAVAAFVRPSGDGSIKTSQAGER